LSRSETSTTQWTSRTTNGPRTSIPKTGEIVTVTDEDRRRPLEDGDLDAEDLPEWQQETLPKMREALESGDFFSLPDKFEIHEWAMMERFSSSQARAARRNELLDAIHGAGAFRSFRIAIRRLGIEHDWFRFRQSEFEEIAKDWLKASATHSCQHLR
jgi:hypothetical protein